MSSDTKMPDANNKHQRTRSGATDKKNKKGLDEYASPEYWLTRYKQTAFKTVDWYLSWSRIRSIFLTEIDRTFGQAAYSVTEEDFNERESVAAEFFGGRRSSSRAREENEDQLKSGRLSVSRSNARPSSSSKSPVIDQERHLLDKLTQDSSAEQNQNQSEPDDASKKQDFEALSHLERSLLQILDVGCGTSEFAFHLYREGFTKVTAIDACKEVTDVMADRFNKLPEIQELHHNLSRSNKSMAHLDVSHLTQIKFLEMDMTRLKFPKDSFDVIVDKAGLDCLFVGAEVFEAVTRYLDGVHRVLRVGGVVFIFSAEAPAKRIKYFDRKRYSWTIAKQQIGHMRWLYILKKAKRIMTAEETISNLGSLYDSTTKMQRLAVSVNEGKLEINETSLRKHQEEKRRRSKARLSLKRGETLNVHLKPVEKVEFSNKLQQLYMQDNSNLDED